MRYGIVVIAILCLICLTGCGESPEKVTKVYSKKTELTAGLQLEEHWTVEGRTDDYLSKTTVVYTYTFDNLEAWSHYLAALMIELDKRMEELQNTKEGRYIILEYRMDGDLFVATETTDYELADKNDEENNNYSMSKIFETFATQNYTEPLVFYLSPTENGVVQEEEEHGSEEPKHLDFAKLKAINPDTVGWIYIPGTQINYPIVQTTDNENYLHTGLDGQESVAGSIFLDYESTSDFSGSNNIIYGHNMKNATMFRDLIQFKDEDFFKEHERFTIYTPERTINLKAVSCYYGRENVDIRRTDFESQEEFDKFVNRIISPCSFARYPDEIVESIYTLVTCSYEKDDARTYLIAVEEK